MHKLKSKRQGPVLGEVDTDIGAEDGQTELEPNTSPSRPDCENPSSAISIRAPGLAKGSTRIKNYPSM